jgi:hypothetical protein
MTVTMGSRRLYVGNLFPGVTEEDLRTKFDRSEQCTVFLCVYYY